MKAWGHWSVMCPCMRCTILVMTHGTTVTIKNIWDDNVGGCSIVMKIIVVRAECDMWWCCYQAVSADHQVCPTALIVVRESWAGWGQTHAYTHHCQPPADNRKICLETLATPTTLAWHHTPRWSWSWWADTRCEWAGWPVWPGVWPWPRLECLTAVLLTHAHSSSHAQSTLRRRARYTLM